MSTTNIIRDIERAIIVFQPMEDLYLGASLNKIIRRSGEEESFYISKPRNFQSYCYEFCGKLDIPYNSMKFRINDKEVRNDFIPRSSCIVKVYNNIQDIMNIGGSALKDSLNKLQLSKKFADVKLLIEDEIIPAHKCI